MINSSAKTIVLSISEKLNSYQRIRICGVQELDILITEKDPTDPLLIPFINKNLTIL